MTIFLVFHINLVSGLQRKITNYIQLYALYYLISCKRSKTMQSPQSSLKKSIAGVIPEDISSRKTKSYHKGNKSQRNNSSQKRNAFQKREPSNALPTQRSSKQQKHQRNHSVKQSKCSSERQYHLLGKATKVSEEVDGKTQINKETLKLKNKEIQQELEHAELLRQGLVNSNERKIKIGSRRRQIISHDILHPPITILATKQKKDKNEVKMAQISLTQSQKLDDQEYEEIVKDVKLNTLQSRIINPPIVHLRKQEYFLAKIQQSQSELISSPLHHKNTFNFTPNASPELIESKTKNIKIAVDESKHSHDKSLFKMDSIEEEAINRSVERTFKQKEAHLASNNDVNGVNIRINPCQSDSEQERATQKRSSNKVEQSKVIIATKVGSDKSYNKVERQANKLKLVTGIIEENIKIQQKKNEEEQQQKKRLNEEINYLKSAVRQLKLQKIKARAELSMTIDVSKDVREDRNSRYEILNASIQEKNEERQQNSGVIIFGKIKKNRSLSRKKENYSMKSHELTAQKEMDLPDPLINANKFPLKVKFDTFVSQKKISHHSIEQRQYKTMNLERINQQNIEQSMKFQGNFTTSINIPTFGSQLRSNKINMRGVQIGNDVLNKFQSSDRRFKHFINQSSSKNRIKSQRAEQGEKRLTQSNSAYQNVFDGVIVNNRPKVIPTMNVNESARGIELESAHLIKQGEKIELIKAKRVFQVKKMPEVPQSPTYSTPTEDIMELILKILPYSNIEYQQQDLQDCILKKYKNCIMFELKRFPNMKLVWYYSGKLYIGEWNAAKNEKCGYGKEFSKDKFYYQGHFKDNKRIGFGSFVSESLLYEGQWLNGEKSGSGKYSDLKENIFYQGEWKCDQKHGKGHFQSQTGIYNGMFNNDVKSRFGIEIFKNGDRYIGFYSNGKFQGEGKYLWYNRSFYLGNFNAGFREGFGKWQSGTQNYEIYIGQFLRDKKQGSGKYIWSNRCVYQGNFFNDLKHGLGSILYPDGRYMQGVWTQGTLTEVISKVTEANREEPLEEPRSRALRSKTFIRVIDTPL